MKRLLKGLLIAAILLGVFVGGIYAYETLWRGKASIMVEPPSGGEAQVEVTSIHTQDGWWDESTSTWEVSIPRGDTARLHIKLENTGGDFATVYSYISDTNPALGVEIRGMFLHRERVIPSGGTLYVGFAVEVATDAEPGKLGDVELAIRCKT